MKLVIIMKTRIRDLREDNDFTQEQIAEHLVCTQSQYSKYELEKREIPAVVLGKLALFYNTSVDYLMYLTDEKQPYPRSLVKR